MLESGDDNKLVYDIHVFCCINEREPSHPRGSCAARGSVNLHKYMKIRSKQLKIERIRVNKAGCLERCELGPVLVIYPQATWYRFDTERDIDDILERHIIGGQTVDRLLLDVDQKVPDTFIEPRLRLQVAGVEGLTDDIKKIEFVAKDGGPLPEFSAGSHIDVFVGNGLRRSYSLANNPADRDRYTIAVLRESKGRGGSDWIHDTLAPGDLLEASPPTNNFSLDDTASEHLMIAGGIGIAPLLSMGRALKSRGEHATLHYCTRSPETTAFAAEVKEVFGDRVTFHHDGGEPSRGIDLARVLADPGDGTCLYVCGPTALIESARTAASHWGTDKVRYERFSAVQPDGPEAKNQAFDIILSRQGRTLNVPADKTILQVVRDAGIDLNWSCENGICGSCRVNLLGGKVDHRDSFLDDNERSENAAIMICSSRAKPGETLILDI